MPTDISNREPPWQAGLRGARANIIPGIVLQIVAIAIVAGYYFHAPTRNALEQLSAFKSETGAIFAVISTALFGGVIPFIYLRTVRAANNRPALIQGAALVLFWAYKGFEVDLLYRILAHTVGEGHDVQTIAIKMALDQFVYGPLIASPSLAIAYPWIESNFKTGALAADMRAGGWYVRRVVPMIISNLGVWLPAVGIIYSLPTPLQLPMQNVVLCFFTLILAHMSARHSDRG